MGVSDHIELFVRYKSLFVSPSMWTSVIINHYYQEIFPLFILH